MNGDVTGSQPSIADETNVAKTSWDIVVFGKIHSSYCVCYRCIFWTEKIHIVKVNL